MTEPCRLCHSKDVASYAHANNRDYLRCNNCHLIFLVRSQLPDLETERAEYRLHNNDPQDEGYRAHLSKLTTPLVEGLPKTAKGLDFGCGSGPTISVMLGEQGYEVANYDPVFFADEELLKTQYDFISCTEVVEHFHYPARDFELLAKLLKPAGRLGIMTQMYDDEINFENWYYTREISHVAFYSIGTFSWITRNFGWQIEILSTSVVCLSRLPVP